jgi:hypothetical protein
MEKQASDEYSSRLSNYDKLVLGDPNVLEIAIMGMNNVQLIEFYEYCVDKYENAEEHSDNYWFASLFLEETPAVKMYKNSQLYIDTTLGNFDEPTKLSEEELNQINETIELLKQRKKDKKNPLKKLLRNIRGR